MLFDIKEIRLLGALLADGGFYRTFEQQYKAKTMNVNFLKVNIKFYR